MCNELKSWCKSFTRTEVWLCLVQATLLAVLITGLTLLILHLLMCSSHTSTIDDNSDTETLVTPKGLNTEHLLELNSSTTFKMSTLKSGMTTSPVGTASLPADIECTWQPSKKTEAPVYYYLTESSRNLELSGGLSHQSYETAADDVSSTGDRGLDKYKDYIAALVKLKPPADVTFGCILTKVSVHWTLTAASCIESVEEVDSLDSFFIVDSLEPMRGSHVVTDIVIHPFYQGSNRSYDLAALRSEDALISKHWQIFRLPSVVEYFLVALGENFTILGYGNYRTIEVSVVGRRVRRVAVHLVSMAQCADEEAAWSARHLAHGAPLAAAPCAGGACGPPPLCVGSLHSRKTPCSYCSGTPLLRAGTLFGVMSENRLCGIACEPALYVNMAAMRDWVVSVIVQY